MFWAREEDIVVLINSGITDRDDDSAYEDFHHPHPSSRSPDVGAVPSKTTLTVDESMLLSCLQVFLKDL